MFAAARRREAGAFAELYRRYLADVREFCARRIGDPVRAEDIAQDTFLKAFERIGSFKPGRAFWPWISTIARNLCIDELRQHRRTHEQITAEPPEPQSARWLVDVTADEVLRLKRQQTLRGAMTTALATLNPRERRMMWRRAVEELSYEEIAQADGISIDAARNAAWRARGSLRMILEHAREDLRNYCLFPLATLSASLRRFWNRVRLRLTPELSEAQLLLIERATAAALGIAVLSVFSLAGPGSSHPPNATAAEREQTQVTGTERRSTLGKQEAHMRLDLKRDQRMPSDVNAPAASIRTKSRPGGGAPASTTYKIEVRDPSGNVLYWQESGLNCGDGRPSQLLPPQSPVRTYC